MSKDLKPKAVLFDLYGTLVDIKTDEYRQELWDTLSRFLRYQEVEVEAQTLQETYFARVQSALDESREEYPELNVPDIFRQLLQELGLKGTPEFFVDFAQLFRTLSMLNFGTYPDTIPTLEALRGHFKLGLVSNAQRIFLETEMKMVGLDSLLNIVVISSDHGFSKPDTRLMKIALEELGVAPEQAIYVGDNGFRDICGAQQAGLTAVLLDRGNDPNDDAESCEPDRTVKTLDQLRQWLVS